MCPCTETCHFLIISSFLLRLLLLAIVFQVVQDLVPLVHVPVVKDAKDVLSRPVDGAAEQEIGEAKVEVLQRQPVVPALHEKDENSNSRIHCPTVATAAYRGHGPVSLPGDLLQVLLLDADKVAVEVAVLVHADDAVLCNFIKNTLFCPIFFTNQKIS